MNWNLNIPLPCDFTEALIQTGLLFKEDTIESVSKKDDISYKIDYLRAESQAKKVKNVAKMYRTICKFTALFVPELMMHTPLKVSASCLYLTRKLLGVCPAW
jgi:hypothetical protein